MNLGDGMELGWDDWVFIHKKTETWIIMSYVIQALLNTDERQF